MLCAAFLGHLCYCLYTGPYTRQHDVHGLADSGHMAYFLHFFNHLSLPQHYNYQFYQPPLHHLIAGLALRLESALGHPPEEGVQCLRFLTLLYTTWAGIVCYRLFANLRLSPAAGFLAFALAAAHPSLSIISGSLNNDALAFLLCMAALHRSLCWHRRPTAPGIALAGLLLALAVLAKPQALLLAAPVGFLFLSRLIAPGRLGAKKLWLQYALFALIAVPLGLSHSLRNFFALGQPLGYCPVPGGIPETTGYSIFQRFIAPFSPKLFTDVYSNAFTGYNLPEYMLRSSLFGEYSFEGVDALARVLTVLGALVLLAGLAAGVWKLAAALRGQRNAVPWLCLGAYALALLGSYAAFYASFPYGCTMDFRYVLPLIPLGAAFIAAGYDLACQKGGVFARAARVALWGLAGLFCTTSALFYLMAI